MKDCWLVSFARLTLMLAVCGVLASALVPITIAPSLGSDWLSHGVAFSILSMLSAMAFPRIPLWRLWVFLTILGCAIEMAQGLPGLSRGPSMMEAAWNALVVAITLLVTFVGNVRHRLRARSQTNTVVT